MVRYTIFIGNPGVGKSTLLNAAIGEATFRSGLNVGTGLTTAMQMVEVNGEYWGDTPGLDDLQTRQQAAKEIAEALRHGDGEYRLIFVVTQESLRIRSADLATMKLVLDAVKAEMNQACDFGVIVNKMERAEIEYVQSSEEVWAAFTGLLQPNGYGPPRVTLLPKVDELVGARDAVHDPPQYFYDFLKDVKGIHITPPQVDDINSDGFDNLQEAYEKLRKEKRRNDGWLKGIGYGAAIVLGVAAVATGVAAVGAAAAGGAAAVGGAVGVGGLEAAFVITGEAVALGLVSAATGAGGVAVGYGASKI